MYYIDLICLNKNLELIVKRDANSLYGTSASIYFSLGDFDVAEDITISGKHSGFHVQAVHLIYLYLQLIVNVWLNFYQL